MTIFLASLFALACALEIASFSIAMASFAALSLTASSNGKRFNFYVAKNGVIMPETKQRIKIAFGADVGVVALSGIVNLALGDYIEVWIENTNDASDVTVESMNLSIL